MKRRGVVKLRMRFNQWYVQRFSGDRLHTEDGPLNWREAEALEKAFVSAGWGKES